MAVTPPEDELSAMAMEELDAALALSFAEMKRITPWGDAFPGFASSGREVEVERRYLWAHEPAGGILVEIEVRDPALKVGAETRALLSPED
jgi:hypothetical protein